MADFNLNASAMPDDDAQLVPDINVKYKLNIIVPIVWSLIIFLGITGNGCVIYIILKRALYKNSCTNCYIINVAIADLCFELVCVPVTMTAYVFKEWIFGNFLCHFQNLLMFSSVQAACLTLTAMTIDRYAAILYPFKSLDFRTTKVAICVNICIWIASFILNTPYYMYYNQHTDAETEDTVCFATFPSKRMEIALTVYTVIISYVLPLLTIIFCYTRMMRIILKKTSEEYFMTEKIGNSPSPSIFSRDDNSSMSINNMSMQNGGGGSDGKNGDKKCGGYYTSNNKLLPKRPKKPMRTIRFVSKGGGGEAGSNNSNTYVHHLLERDDYENENELRRCATENEDTDDGASDCGGGRLSEARSSGSRQNELSSNDSSRTKSNRSTTLPVIVVDNVHTKKNKKKQKQKQKMLMMRTTMSKSTLSVSSRKLPGGASTASYQVSCSRQVRKQKTKILVLIATVSVTFALTWLPAHIIQIWKIAFNSSFPYSEPMYIMKMVAHTLSYSNSLLNPFIYVFIGTKFRRHFFLEFDFLFKKCFKSYANNIVNNTSTRLSVNNNNKHATTSATLASTSTALSVKSAAENGASGAAKQQQQQQQQQQPPESSKSIVRLSTTHQFESTTVV